MRWLAVLLALTVPAFAQDPNQPPTVVPQTPLDQALSEKLLNEVYLGVQCRQQAIALQAALGQAQVQVEDLKKQLAQQAIALQSALQQAQAQIEDLKKQLAKKEPQN